MKSINGHVLGAIKSPPDARDYLIKNYIPKAIVVPTELSYRSKMTPVKNQKMLGSCVAFASLAVLEYHHLDNVSFIPDLSEMWLYTKCKQSDGYPNEEGTDLRTACEVMRVGVCSESMFPYTDKYPAPYNPDSGAGTNSAIYKIKTYAAASINELKTGLVSFSPLMVAIAIYENFDVDKDGFMLPAQGEIVGGHAICCVGYKDTQIKPNGCCLSFLGLRKPKKITSSTEGYFEFKNSWGTDWADKGYFKIRYSDLPKVFWEARSIVDD